MERHPEYHAIARFLFKDLRDTLGWIAGEEILIERIELALRRCPELTGHVTHDVSPADEDQHLIDAIKTIDVTPTYPKTADELLKLPEALSTDDLIIYYIYDDMSLLAIDDTAQRWKLGQLRDLTFVKLRT